MNKDEGQVIQYIDGGAWGIAPQGKTVYLGTQEEVKDLLAAPRGKIDNPVVAQIVTLEKKLAKEQQQQEDKAQAKVTALKKERHQLAVKLGIAKTRPKKSLRLKTRKIQPQNKTRP